ncbi:hypothetical protein BH24ACI4_BH24ACI4_22830 [soil metagenome]
MAGHRSFAGWYISQEIDDVHWRTPEADRILVRYLRDLTRDLRVSGAHPVAVSAFSNAAMNPRELATFWAGVLTETEIDLLLFQDGIGTEKLDLVQLPQYLQALNGAVRHAGRSLRVIVEAFRQTSGPAINDLEFRAEPAPFERIRTQLALAAQHSTAPAVLFSAPDYMRPSAGPEGAELFDRYTAWRQSACR